MSEWIPVVIAWAGLLGAGGTAGIAFAFSNFLMASFDRLPAPESIRSMQQINRQVYNPLFMGGLFGTTLVSAAGIGWGLLNLRTAGAMPLIIAGAFYIVGVFLVTGLGNVPLNHALDRLAPEDAEGATHWRRYRRPWTRWNHVRVIAAAAALIFFAAALAAA
jgi:uncharacterized membrane protein